MFLTTDELSQRICNSSAPILFLDTCIFLDIIRSTFRDNIHVDAIAATLNLIKLAEKKPCQVWLLSNETVHNEWIDNIENVKQELRKEVERLEHTREKLVIAANVILKIEHAHGQKITALGLHEHLENLSQSFLDHCLRIKQEDIHSIRAMHRVYKSLPPAKKGKPEPKDCVILETFLDISGRVRKLGYVGEIYFVTSNSSDYGKPNNPYIADELNAVGATLISNLPSALAKIEGRA